MQTDTTVPSAIDFGKGQPSLSLLPAAALHTAAERVLAQHDPLWLRYGDDQDEAPTDFLALDIFRDHGLRVVGVPIDDEGMQMPALHDALAAHRPSMLYTIPSFQNPTGATLSASRREQLLASCAAHDVLVVADEVYQLLDFGAPPPPSVATYVSGARVLSLGSFSKICAPGLRLGWVHGAPALLEQLMHAGLVQSGGGLNPFTSGVVHSLITLGLADRVLDDLKLVYAERSRVLCEALRDAIPDARLVEPSGGYFVWVQLPGVSAVELLPVAREAGVAFHAGPRFATDDQFGDTLRLSFAHYDSDMLREGVQRLARARRRLLA
ncbi:PLP-dependent aminotransferase family protein [Gemmatimonas sp.]|uniref:aminotransferase-like domain-containing protein n=1 Tax=Gemmatimonas sp. TaxID=1962908 RepID=UPI003F7089B9